MFFSCKTAWKFFLKKDLVLVVSSRVVRRLLDMSSSGNWQAHHVLTPQSRQFEGKTTTNSPTLLPYIQLDSFIPF